MTYEPKYCFTCKEELTWIKKQGVGKFNGFYDCPSHCKVKFPPKEQPTSLSALKPINTGGVPADGKVILLLADEITNLRKEIAELKQILKDNIGGE
jgi:hypothetical protein